MTNAFGRCSWFDLPSSDPIDTMSFYEGLFGWAFKRMRDPAIENYWVIEKDGDLIGGLRVSAPPVKDGEEMNGAVLYFTVEQLTTAVIRAKELGARLVGERVDMGQGRGGYQWLRDRQGNLIALWSLQ